MTLYDILGVTPNATEQDIKTAYRNMLKAFHPDYYAGDKKFAEQKTRELVEAYKVLKDVVLRAEYDAMLFGRFHRTEENNEQPETEEPPAEAPATESPAPEPLKLGMAWFEFYTNIRLPLGILMVLFTLPPSIKNLQASSQIHFGNIAAQTYITLLLVIILVQAAFLFYCVFNLRKFKQTAYRLNIYLLCIENIVAAFSQGTNVKQFAIFFFMWFCGFTIPNFIYFYKRRSLFFLNENYDNDKIKKSLNSFSKKAFVYRAAACILVFSMFAVNWHFAFAVPVANAVAQEATMYDGGLEYENYFYVLENGTVYHRADCRYVQNAMGKTPENVYYAETRGEAQSYGYNPCKVCNP